MLKKMCGPMWLVGLGKKITPDITLTLTPDNYFSSY